MTSCNLVQLLGLTTPLGIWKGWQSCDYHITSTSRCKLQKRELTKVDEPNIIFRVYTTTCSCFTNMILKEPRARVPFCKPMCFKNVPTLSGFTWTVIWLVRERLLGISWTQDPRRYGNTVRQGCWEIYRLFKIRTFWGWQLKPRICKGYCIGSSNSLKIPVLL